MGDDQTQYRQPLHRRLFTQLIRYHCTSNGWDQHKNDAETDLTLPENQRQMVGLLLHIISNLTRTHTVFLSIEDLHWADAGTVALVKGLVNAFTGNGLFALFSVRSGGCPPLIKAAMNQSATSISLLPFGSDHSSVIVEKLFSQAPLPETVRQEIITQTDGIPLYIEAFCWHLLDQLHPGTSTPNNDASVIPDCLQDELNARIDAVGPYKTQLQIASVFGCKFPA